MTTQLLTRYDWDCMSFIASTLVSQRKHNQNDILAGHVERFDQYYFAIALYTIYKYMQMNVCYFN